MFSVNVLNDSSFLGWARSSPCLEMLIRHGPKKVRTGWDICVFSYTSFVFFVLFLLPNSVGPKSFEQLDLNERWWWPSHSVRVRVCVAPFFRGVCSFVHLVVIKESLVAALLSCLVLIEDVTCKTYSYTLNFFFFFKHELLCHASFNMLIALRVLCATELKWFQM